MSPVMQQVQPVDERAIRETYAFAEAFGDLSKSMVDLASTLKKQGNEEEFEKGRLLVNSNRKTYADLIRTGQINPSENPWMAVGAQTASGVLEASRARNEFQVEYDRQISQNPDLLQDNQFFDALASSFAAKKQQEFGTASYLSNAFFDSFNPYMVSMGSTHSQQVAKYRQQKIVQSLRLRVDEAVQQMVDRPDFGTREDGTQKGEGFLGVYYDMDGNAVSELSTTINIDGSEVELPLLVPGLSLSAREHLVYNNGSFDDLGTEDQITILLHAKDRMLAGKSTFFSGFEDKILPELQGYMDEMGANMGMPRIANLAVATHLIEAMKSSSATYEAEDLLRKLRGGTGLISETEEVRVLLAEAQEDIQKNRFELQNSREKTVVGLAIEAAYKDSYASGGELGYEKNYDALDQLLNKLSTLSVEDRAKFRDQFNERWNNAAREGRESLVRQDLFVVRSSFTSSLANAASRDGVVLDWGSLRTKHDDVVRRLGNDPSGEVGKDALGKIHTIIEGRLSSMNQAFIDELNANASRYGVPPGSIESLTPLSTDSKDLKDAKEQLRIRYKMNEFLAAYHFGMEDRLEGIRRIALGGISFDVERGVKPELVDLVRLYENLEGRGMADYLAGKGEQGARLIRFLQDVAVKTRGQMPLPDAVRDSAQQLRLNEASSPLSLADLKPGATQLEDLSRTLSSIENDYVDSYWPFGFGDVPIHPDSQASFRAMFNRRYVEEMSRTAGDHEAAKKAAKDYIYNETLYVRNSFLPKQEFSDLGISEEYLANFIDLESQMTDASLVVVGFAPNGETVLALRTKDGSAVNDKYYTASRIASNEKPRDESGNIVPGSLSMRERVVERMGSSIRSKRLTPSEGEAVRSGKTLPGYYKFKG